MNPQKVLLVEDEPRMARLVCDLLVDIPDVMVAGTALDAQNLACSFGPDIMVVDLGLPDLDGVDLIRSLRRAKIDVPILVLTSATAPSRILDALRAGAKGYLFKDDLGARLQSSLREIYGGGASLSSGAASVVLGQLESYSPGAGAPTLTRQEARVLDLLALGLSYEEIGRETSTTINTIRTHVRTIYDKLGVENRAEAVNLGWRFGLLRNGSS